MAEKRSKLEPTRIVYSMRALGKGDLPATLRIGEGTYRHESTHKHDFWAATGFYVSDTGEKIVLKISRTEDFAGLPLEWIGRWLCRRELRFYRAMADLPNIPAIVGTIGPTGFAHVYVPGRPLSRRYPVPDGFFNELIELMREVHRRDIAYVDANKPENILLGDDGHPKLIDFQISYDLREWGDHWWTRRILTMLQREDLYHVLKHKRKLRPDEPIDERWKGTERTSAIIRFHRFITLPYFRIRRRTFERLRQSGRLLPEGNK